MTNKAKAVFKGFTELNSMEQKSVLEEIRMYLDQSEIKKGEINERLSNDVKRVLGPTSSDFCPCCGK